MIGLTQCAGLSNREFPVSLGGGEKGCKRTNFETGMSANYIDVLCSDLRYVPK